MLRTGVFLFVAEAFLGNCWQLWVGGLIFVLPQLLDFVAERLPNSERLFQFLPRGVALVLLAHDREQQAGQCQQHEASLFGRDGPTPARSWRNEIAGALSVLLSVALVLNG